MVSGVECSTEVQESEKHQVTTICTAQDVVKDTKYGSLTTVLGGMLIETCQGGHAGIDGRLTVPQQYVLKVKRRKEGSKQDDSFLHRFVSSPFFFSRGLITAVFGTMAE